METETGETLTVEDFFEEREVRTPSGGKSMVWVAIRPMTRDQARLFYPNRPFSNYAESRFGGNNLIDDSGLLIMGSATRCNTCQAPTRNPYLVDGKCPDCDGRSAAREGVV